MTEQPKDYVPRAERVPVDGPVGLLAELIMCAAGICAGVLIGYLVWGV